MRSLLAPLLLTATPVTSCVRTRRLAIAVSERRIFFSRAVDGRRGGTTPVSVNFAERMCNIVAAPSSLRQRALSSSDVYAAMAFDYEYCVWCAVPLV